MRFGPGPVPSACRQTSHCVSPLCGVWLLSVPPAKLRGQPGERPGGKLVPPRAGQNGDPVSALFIILLCKKQTLGIYLLNKELNQ